MRSQWPEAHQEQGHTVASHGVYIAKTFEQSNIQYKCIIVGPQNPINCVSLYNCMQAVNPSQHFRLEPPLLDSPGFTL